jgi:hypothetical protein
MEENQETQGKGSGEEVTQETNVNEKPGQQAEANGEEEKSYSELSDLVQYELSFVHALSWLLGNVICDSDDRLKAFTQSCVPFF